jgi:hypothetical protein
MMTNQILLYIGSFLLVFWGIAHLFPTKSVVKEFGDISLDNKRIITMEWINEGATLIFIGIIIAAVTCMDHTHAISKTVYRISFLMLNAMSIISLFTGFKIKFLPFKLCPVIFTGTSILIIVGMYT